VWQTKFPISSKKIARRREERINLRRVGSVDVERKLELEELVSLSPVTARGIECKKDSNQQLSHFFTAEFRSVPSLLLLLNPLAAPAVADELTPQSRIESYFSRSS